MLNCLVVMESKEMVLWDKKKSPWHIGALNVKVHYVGEAP